MLYFLNIVDVKFKDIKNLFKNYGLYGNRVIFFKVFFRGKVIFDIFLENKDEYI